MIYAILFEDDTSRAAIRTEHMPAHLAFLEQNAPSIEAAGPLLDKSNEIPAGGLWIVRADSPERVQALIEADPFWPTGLRKSVRILEWTQVFAGGKRRI